MCVCVCVLNEEEMRREIDFEDDSCPPLIRVEAINRGMLFLHTSCTHSTHSSPPPPPLIFPLTLASYKNTSALGCWMPDLENQEW